eukprot:TRINITY_DN3292_c0_g1_i1.p1 TRINITY_DN3292_c0_g1~~TRINITY_DN3292_c0_g1_i1.p1  ORF type:complete len:401 (-),score=136.30 TRINITY_DN3292_c0_g1_i1:71-1273(-)
MTDINDSISKQQKQLEFYFSYENIVSDTYLRNNMDDNSWVDINVVKNFFKMRQLGSTFDSIVDAVEKSEFIELNEDKTKIRAIIPSNDLVLKFPLLATSQDEKKLKYAFEQLDIKYHKIVYHNDCWNVVFTSSSQCELAKVLISKRVDDESFVCDGYTDVKDAHFILLKVEFIDIANDVSKMLAGEMNEDEVYRLCYPLAFFYDENSMKLLKECLSTQDIQALEEYLPIFKNYVEEQNRQKHQQYKNHRNRNYNYKNKGNKSGKRNRGNFGKTNDRKPQQKSFEKKTTPVNENKVKLLEQYSEAQLTASGYDKHVDKAFSLNDIMEIVSCMSAEELVRPEHLENRLDQLQNALVESPHLSPVNKDPMPTTKSLADNMKKRLKTGSEQSIKSNKPPVSRSS